MAKVFCTCKGAENSYYGLHPPNLKGYQQWVHLCGKPTKDVWYRLLKTCPLCFGLYSSPWSPICRTCHAEESAQGATFRGWAWAKRADEEWHKNLRRTLDAGASLGYDTEVEGQTPHAPDPPQE